MRTFVLAAALRTAHGAACTQLCPGFLPEDCSCTDAGDWAMWVCTSRQGVFQSQAYFCSQPTCGCNGGDGPIDDVGDSEPTQATTSRPPAAPVPSPPAPQPGGGQNAAGGARQLLFKNACPQSVVVKYSQGGHRFNQYLATLEPSGGSHVFDIQGQADKGAWVFSPFFADIHPSDRDVCPPDFCHGWSLSKPRQGYDWTNGPQYAAVCNPNIPACCGKHTPGYDAATGDCPGVNDMTWGTEVEFTFDGWGGIDSFDISTNFNLEGGAYFNIPVALSAVDGDAPLKGCNNAHGEVQWPIECLRADCTTAYQTPTDEEGNGAQLQCPAGSSPSYVVEFCPRGEQPLQGLSDAALPPLGARASGSPLASSSAAGPGVLLSVMCSLLLSASATAAWRRRQPRGCGSDADEEETELLHAGERLLLHGL